MRDDDGLTQPVIEKRSVGKARERIVKALIFERLLLGAKAHEIAPSRRLILDPQMAEVLARVAVENVFEDD